MSVNSLRLSLFPLKLAVACIQLPGDGEPCTRSLTQIGLPLSQLITPMDVLPGTSIMTSGFTNPRDGAGRPAVMSCTLVVSVVRHSSVGLAER